MQGKVVLITGVCGSSGTAIQARLLLLTQPPDTGGANGLGLATARQLGALGAHVLIADVDAAAGRAAAQGIRQDVQGWVMALCEPRLADAPLACLPVVSAPSVTCALGTCRARVTVLPRLDLSSQASVHHFCDSLLGSSRPPALHVLVNNAGGCPAPRSRQRQPIRTGSCTSAAT